MIGGQVERSQIQDAFEGFSEIADQVQAAWRTLHEYASRLDRDLANANERLRGQVDALESLSGSLAAVLRAIPCGVVVADTHGMVVMANPAAEEILGLKGRALIGRMAEELVDARGATLLSLVAGPGRGGERVLHTDGGLRIVDGVVVTATDTEGAALGLVEIINDKSEVKALREEVRRLDSLAELGRVAAIIAHEIRNPLSGIRGFAGMLERHFRAEETDGPRHRWARRICDGVERADAIIDSVLYLARPRPKASAPVRIAELVRSALDAVAAADPARLRGVSIETRVEPEDLTVPGDAVRLQQALCNLVENGLIAMAGAGTLRIRAGRDGEVVRLEVADDGPGVPADVRARLFEPFFTTRTDGAGLGLALVSRIAEVHGGTVECPVTDRGATFVITLPAGGTDQEGAER